jgi:signal transduction histidine kinase
MRPSDLDCAFDVLDFAPLSGLAPTGTIIEPLVSGHGLRSRLARRLGFRLVAVDLAFTALEVALVGFPLAFVLVTGGDVAAGGAAVGLGFVNRVGILATLAWIAGSLRLVDVVRPLVTLAATRARGHPVSAPLVAETQRALARMPREAALVRFGIWALVALVATGLALARGALTTWTAAGVCGVSVIHGAGLAAARATVMERLLLDARSTLLPNVEGVRLYMSSYRAQVFRTSLYVGAGGHLLFLVVSLASVALAPADAARLLLLAWPIWLVALVPLVRSFHRRTAEVEAYFDVVLRQPRTRGPSRDEPAAVPAFVAAQSLPYRMTLYQMVALGFGLLFAIASGRFALGLGVETAARLVAAMAVVLAVVKAFELLLLREDLRPFLRHLGSRHHLPLAQIRSTVSLRARLGLAFFGILAAALGLSALGFTGSTEAGAFVLPALGGALALALGHLVVLDVTGPLLALEGRTEEMARGELARPVASAGEADELGRLTVAFEEMRRALRDRLRSTESINVDLEREVRRRTDALEQRNHELHEAMDKLRRAQDDLVRSEKLASMGRLVAGIAHEINNPVNAVINTLGPLEERLAELKMSGETSEMLSVIRRGADRTRAIVRALHNYSRGEEVERREVPLLRSIADTLDLLRHRLHGIDVQVDVGAVRIWALPGQIDQVFMNLIANAAQALGERGGTIRIDAADGPANTVVVQIADDGPGIPAEALPRIFDPFFTTKGVGEGSGLGLSIVHGIVERHGGRIEVTTELGRGTTFKVHLQGVVQDATSTGGG